MKNPSYFDIIYFVEVAETLNVSRAAERLGISQPSLSTSIKRLEDSLDTALLVRTKAGVKLTKSGQIFLMKSKELIEKWNEIKTHVTNSSEEISGIYKVGCHSSVGLYSLPNVLPALLLKYPKLEVQLQHDLSRVIYERVISFELDVAVVVNPLSHPDLVIKELYKDTVHFWVSPQYKKSSEELTLICDPNLLQTQDLIQKVKKKKNFRRLVTTSNLELVAHLTSQGLGIGIIPTKVVESQAVSLKKYDDSLPIFTDRICLIYRADLPKTMAVKEIIKALSDTQQK